MTNLTISKIAGTTIVDTTVAEFTAFIMDKKSGVTVPVLEAELTTLGVAFHKKDSKQVKAGLLFDKLSAIGETLVAETKHKEEQSMDIKLKEVLAAGGLTEKQREARGMKELPAPSVLSRKDLGIFHAGATHSENRPLKDMLDKVHAAKDRYFNNIGENAVNVVRISFYPEKSEASREEVRNNKYIRTNSGKNANGETWSQTFIGEAVFQLPKDYAQIKWYNSNKPNPKTGRLGDWEWIDFNDGEVAYDGDFTKSYNTRRKPAVGSGLIVLSIKEGKDGRPTLNLPVEPNKKGGSPFPIFKTADVRYINTKNAVREDEPMYVADNNAWFNAQAVAFVQVFSNEFVQENVENRNGFNESCATCVHAVRLMQRDGVNGDLETESKKSRAVLEAVDTTQLSQVGAYEPSMVCGISQKFKDIEAMIALNKATEFERIEYQDEEGRTRFQSYNEVMIKGQAISISEYRENATAPIANACTYYHMNAPKTEAAISKEKTEAREAGKNDYVSPFYKTRARVGRQAIQTLIEVDGVDTWVNKFPGEVEVPYAFRVKSAGLTVYGTAEVMGFIDPEFVAEVEPFDARRADVAKKISHIQYAARNYAKLDAEQVKIVHALVVNKPENMDIYEEQKFERAVSYFKQAIKWDLENQEARAAEIFATKFFAGYVEGAVKIRVQDIMGETMKRAEEGTMGYGIGYDDLSAEEFTRYLDEVSLDYVWNVISNGTTYCLVAEGEESDDDQITVPVGREYDEDLAAAAMQAMLQRELTSNYYVFATGERRDVSLVSNVRRDADPQAALDELNACVEVKAYIAKLVGINE